MPAYEIFDAVICIYNQWQLLFLRKYNAQAHFLIKSLTYDHGIPFVVLKIPSFSFMTFHRIFDRSNPTAVTNAYISGTHEVTPGFLWGSWCLIVNFSKLGFWRSWFVFLYYFSYCIVCLVFALWFLITHLVYRHTYCYTWIQTLSRLWIQKVYNCFCCFLKI